MQWFASNWQGLFSIVSLFLGAGVIIANMAHRADVAATLESLEETMKKIGESGKDDSAPKS